MSDPILQVIFVTLWLTPYSQAGSSLKKAARFPLHFFAFCAFSEKRSE